MADEKAGFVPELTVGLVGMVPFVGSIVQPLARHLAGKMMEERERNASSVLDLACTRAGMSREDLAALLDREPRLVTLVNRVLYAAGMNGQTSVLLILAGYLGDAFDDTSRVDDAHTVLSAISSLGEHHILALAVLSEPGEMDGRGEDVHSDVWDIDHVLGHLAIRPEMVRSAIQGLLAGGFATATATIPGSDGTFYAGDFVQISDLGRALLSVLDEIKLAQD